MRERKRTMQALWLPSLLAGKSSKPQGMKEEPRQNLAAVWVEAVVLGSQYSWSVKGSILEKSSRKKESCTERELQWSLEGLLLEYSADYWSVLMCKKGIWGRGKKNLHP